MNIAETPSSPTNAPITSAGRTSTTTTAPTMCSTRRTPDGLCSAPAASSSIATGRVAPLCLTELTREPPDLRPSPLDHATPITASPDVDETAANHLIAASSSTAAIACKEQRSCLAGITGRTVSSISRDSPHEITEGATRRSPGPVKIFSTSSRRPSAAAGCARLASLAVLANTTATSSCTRNCRLRTRRRPTPTAGIEGGGVARRANRSSPRSPWRYRPERTTVTGCVQSSRGRTVRSSPLRNRTLRSAGAGETDQEARRNRTSPTGARQHGAGPKFP